MQMSPILFGVGRQAPDDPFGHMVEQVVDYAIFGLDVEGRIRSWNRGAQQLKGYTAEEAVGRHFAMFYTEQDRAAGLPDRVLEQAREAGRVETTGWRVRKDGSRFWADVVVTALHDDEGRLSGYAKVVRDLTEQHERELQLRESEERLRLLVGQVVDYSIIGLDPHGVIRSWNRGAEELKGYSADEAIGSSFSMFYTDEDRRAGLPESLLSVARETGRVEHSGWRIRKDGSRFWGDVVITALHDAEGRLTGYAKVTRDRTDLKALEDAQDAFYAAFNHDFRTPVTTMKGFVDALRQADDPATREALIRRVELSADRLLGMVEGLVQFATQRAGHAELTLADIDIVQVVRGAIQDLPPELRPHRVRLADDLVIARANGVALHRVVTNLLVNALKYSPPDSPVTVDFDRPRPGRIRMSVSDRGRGIHPDDQPTIFEEFERGRLAEDDGGTGVGLASVRELVEQQGGAVDVESTVGVGTTMAVELPSTRTLKAAAPVQRGPSSSVSVGEREPAGAPGSGDSTGHPSG